VIGDVPPKKELFYKDIAINKMQLDGDGAAYSLKDGVFYKDGQQFKETNKEAESRLLRLALFYEWLAEDPFVSGSTLNLNEFDKNLKLAEKENEIMAPSLEGKKVYPENFLEKFVISTKSYNNFMQGVSEAAAKKLIIDSKKTIQAYTTDAAEKISFIQEYKTLGSSPSNNKKIAYLGGETSTSMDLIGEDLKTILSNGKVLMAEAVLREKCFAESEFYCERPALGSQKPEKETETESVPPQLISKKYPSLVKAMFEYQGLKKHRGIYQIESPCWGKKNTQYLYISDLDADGLRYQLEYLADKIYFIKPGILSSFDRKVREMGIGALLQPATTSYACPDLTYKPKMAVLDGFFTGYANNKLFAENMTDSKASPTTDIIKEGMRAENDLFAAKYPSENDLEYLGDYYGYAWAYFKKNDINFKRSDELLKRYVLIKEKLYNFDLVMGKLLFDYRYFNKMFAANNITLDIGFIYPTKGNYSVLFFNFSDFIWKIQKKPQYIYKTDPDKADFMPNYDAFIDHEKAIAEFGLEKLIKWSEMTRGLTRY